HDPKFGIYRSLNSVGDLRDEDDIRFADFCFSKVSADECAEGPGLPPPGDAGATSAPEGGAGTGGDDGGGSGGTQDDGGASGTGTGDEGAAPPPAAAPRASQPPAP